MPGALDDGDGLLAGADLLYLAQGGAGDHEGEGVGPPLFAHGLPAQGQAVAVYRHHGELVALYLEQGAGVDGAALVVADGEQGLGDHGAQGGLGEGQAVLLVHGGQLGELLRVHAQNVELRQAALDVDHIALGGEDYHVVGQLADDLAEQPGGQDQGAGLCHLGGDGGLDAGL